MLKSELIRTVAQRANVSQETAREVLDAMADVVKECAGTGTPVMLAGLGKLVFRRRPPRLSRNIRTGATVPVPARTVPALKPSDALYEAANP